MTEQTKSAFFISPIGSTESDERKRSNKVFKNLLEPILSQYGYKLERADMIAHAGSITNVVIRRTINDDLVVADLSGHNPNVFYELAVRHAAGKPCIHIMEEGTSKIPFDVSDQNTLNYKLGSKARERSFKDLLSRVVESIHNGEPFENPVTKAVGTLLAGQSNESNSNGFNRQSADNQLDVSMTCVFQRQNISPNVPQWGFELVLEAVNQSSQTIRKYAVEVSVPRALIPGNANDHLELPSKASKTHRIFQFPPPKYKEIVELMPGRPQKLGIISCLISKYNLPDKDRIMSTDILIDTFANDMPPHQQRFPISDINPFKLMNVDPANLVHGQNYELSALQEQSIPPVLLKQFLGSLNRGEFVVLHLFLEKSKRNLSFDSACYSTVSVLKTLVQRGLLKCHHQDSSGVVLTIGDDVWSMIDKKEFRAQALEMLRTAEPSFLALIKQGCTI